MLGSLVRRCLARASEEWARVSPPPPFVRLHVATVGDIYKSCLTSKAVNCGNYGKLLVKGSAGCVSSTVVWGCEVQTPRFGFPSCFSRELSQ